ncbi:hypothetical protein FEM48_Zijuj07G0150800 [Ziziphus jujuba var. spinosa]|uniref:non-reducing end alpha-L-arabinofuranosidase n=1 Tax=Ziziphus jujuba var. spinosa TaxID=714518 RepID=A0A978V5C0_ZIZJJ|nr:hypothetical protein FEM48_Zijuj07G0150800 [Ziziphus jujuba var. spinosa]
MASCKAPHCVRLVYLFLSFACQCFAIGVDADNSDLLVEASEASGRPIPDTLFGIFFEEINHAGAGGLWAELVSNRVKDYEGFRNESDFQVLKLEALMLLQTLILGLLLGMLFERNKIALRLDVLCDSKGPNACPAGGSIDVAVLLTDSSGQKLAAADIIASASELSDWKKVEIPLVALGTSHNTRFQLTTTRKGVIWFDQVSLRPLDTYKENMNLFVLILDNPELRLHVALGGYFVEGDWLRDAFRWKDMVGPWEERPGHFGDVWLYWTDDALGYMSFSRWVSLKLQLSEDLGALPVWVFNNGVSHHDEVDSSVVKPFVQEALDGIEFARGPPDLKWGSLRASMGHPEPFDLRYVAIGNEDCSTKNYRGNYLKFYAAIKHDYPDIKIISNCDGSNKPLDHPADLYDFHVNLVASVLIYTTANDIFSKNHRFDNVPRKGPKAFVSEYAVNDKRDAGRGSFLAALAEAGFLIGLERNSKKDRNLDAIVFNSSSLYGTPSYWVLRFFTESSGATLLKSVLQTNFSSSLVASAISWKNSENDKDYIRIKVVNYGSNTLNLKISVDGLENSIQASGSNKTVLISTNLLEENSFSKSDKVVPQQSPLENAAAEMDVVLPPHSLTSFDLLKGPSYIRITGAYSFSRSSI